jgi:uncharacterized phosphatase
MNICLIRHGETDWNIAGRLQGREDVPLNKNGELQAMNCGLALSKQTWKAVITSPLLRAKQTADIIAGVLGIREVYKDFDLIERDYGKASGLTPEERAELFPDGKFEGIENWEPLRDRICGAVIRNTEKFLPESIIIVSHGGAINSVLAELSGHEIGTGKTRLKNACINMLTYEERTLKIKFFNKSCEEI